MLDNEASVTESGLLLLLLLPIGDDDDDDEEDKPPEAWPMSLLDSTPV